MEYRKKTGTETVWHCCSKLQGVARRRLYVVGGAAGGRRAVQNLPGQDPARQVSRNAAIRRGRIISRLAAGAFASRFVNKSFGVLRLRSGQTDQRLKSAEKNPFMAGPSKHSSAAYYDD